MNKPVQASKVRKGHKVYVNGVLVLVTRREKWNSKRVKIHFQDAGNGLPLAQFGVQFLSITEKFFDTHEQLDTEE